MATTVTREQWPDDRNHRAARRFLDQSCADVDPHWQRHWCRAARRARRAELRRTTRRRRTHTPDEGRRWDIARAHMHDRRYCWSSLVDWALYGPGTADHDPGEDKLAYARETRSCRSAVGQGCAGACYCSKFAGSDARPTRHFHRVAR